MVKLTSALVLLLVWLPGCSSDASDPGPKVAHTSSLPKIIRPQLPAPVTAASAEVAKLADVETKRVGLTAPDWLATAVGDLWVRLDNGQVVRLDPVTGDITSRINPSHGEGLCQAFGANGDGAVFSCPYAGVIERLDPGEDKVVAKLDSTFSTDQGHLVTADGKVWVITGESGDEITPIDPGDNSLGKPIGLGSYCVELGENDSIIYAACTSDGLVLRVDVARRIVTHRLALTGPRTIAVSSSGVFVSFDGGVAQLDPDDLEPLAVYDVPLQLGGGIYAESDRVWLRAEGDPFLTVIDPIAHEVVQTITAPELPSGGNAIRIGDVVWATASDDGTLVGLKTR